MEKKGEKNASIGKQKRKMTRRGNTTKESPSEDVGGGCYRGGVGGGFGHVRKDWRGKKGGERRMLGDSRAKKKIQGIGVEYGKGGGGCIKGDRGESGKRKRKAQGEANLRNSRRNQRFRVAFRVRTEKRGEKEKGNGAAGKRKKKGKRRAFTKLCGGVEYLNQTRGKKKKKKTKRGEQREEIRQGKGVGDWAQNSTKRFFGRWGNETTLGPLTGQTVTEKPPNNRGIGFKIEVQKTNIKKKGLKGVIGQIFHRTRGGRCRNCGGSL